MAVTAAEVLLDEEDVTALAGVLGKLHRRLGDAYRQPVDPVATAVRLLKARRQRASLFGPAVGALLGEAAYDMLLDLYVEQAAGRQTSVMSACVASGVPETTALRCLERLIAAGAVCRTADESDRRRSLVSLTSDMVQRLEAHLAALC